MEKLIFLFNKENKLYGKKMIFYFRLQIRSLEKLSKFSIYFKSAVKLAESVDFYDCLPKAATNLQTSQISIILHKFTAFLVAF